MSRFSRFTWSANMKFLSRIFAAIPILPAMGGVLKNRRNSASRMCAPADVSQNVSDWYFSWVNRTPPRSAIMKDKDGHHVGAIHRKP